MVDVAIIGAGAIGGVHARLIDSIDGARVCAVISSRTEAAKALARPRGAQTATSLDDLIAEGTVPDVVSVCTPSAGHADLAIRAVELGCHVFLEKPVDITAAAAERLARAAERSDRQVAVVSQRRFLPTSVALREAVDAGLLGRLTGGTTESPFFRPQSYYDSGDWRGTLEHDGGGALMNQGIHALDLLLWLLGAARGVTGFSSTVAHERIDVEDVIGAVVLFENGCVGTVFSSTAAFPGEGVRLSVFGTRGTATIGEGRLILRLENEERIIEDDAPDGWTSIDWAHRAQYLDLFAAIEADGRPAVGVEDGQRALAAVLGAYESIRTGRAVPLRSSKRNSI